MEYKIVFQVHVMMIVYNSRIWKLIFNFRSDVLHTICTTLHYLSALQTFLSIIVKFVINKKIKFDKSQHKLMLETILLIKVQFEQQNGVKPSNKLL